VNRRRLLLGLGGAAVTAPFVCRDSGLLMPVRPIPVPAAWRRVPSRWVVLVDELGRHFVRVGDDRALRVEQRPDGVLVTETFAPSPGARHLRLRATPVPA
jgi:hypothetical protein